MIKFDVITIFPKIFDSYLNESLILRAQKKKFIKINIHNLRDFTNDNHQTVDDRPFGGGLGMVLKIQPIYDAVESIKSQFTIHNLQTNPKSKILNLKSKVILFTPRGKKFTQGMATKLSKMDQIIFICGRYEGVDERVAQKIADMELSIGDYDLMGGELPAMVCIEAISRLVPGVLGKEALLTQRITRSGGFIEYAQYTRPEVFLPMKGKTLRPSSGRQAWRVPKILLSGDHKEIEAWKTAHGKVIE